MRVGLTRPNADETDGITSRESWSIESDRVVIEGAETDMPLKGGDLGLNNNDSIIPRGWIVAGLDNFEIVSDTALMARALHENTNDILETMKLSSHAKRLSGYDNKIDIEFCSRVNTQPIIPLLEGNQIVLS